MDLNLKGPKPVPYFLMLRPFSEQFFLSETPESTVRFSFLSREKHHVVIRSLEGAKTSDR